MKHIFASLMVGSLVLSFSSVAVAEPCPAVVLDGGRLRIESEASPYLLHLALSADSSGEERVSTLDVEDSTGRKGFSVASIRRGGFLAQSVLLQNTGTVGCAVEEGGCSDGGIDSGVEENFEFSRYWSVDDKDYAVLQYRNTANGGDFVLLLTALRDPSGELLSYDAQCLDLQSPGARDAWFNTFLNGIEFDGLEGSCNERGEVPDCSDGEECFIPSISTNSCLARIEIYTTSDVDSAATFRSTLTKLRTSLKHARLFETTARKKRTLARAYRVIDKVRRIQSNAISVKKWKDARLTRVLKLLDRRRAIGQSARRANRILDWLITELPAK